LGEDLAHLEHLMANADAERLRVHGIEPEALRRGTQRPILALPGDKVTLLGFSFGGWLAAEVAAACSHRLEKLILVDPLGIKVSDRETPDILDIFNKSPDEVRRRSWHDPDRFAPDYNAMSDEALVVHARNREALCLYGWHP